MGSDLVLVVTVILFVIEEFIIWVGFSWYYKYGIRIFKRKGLLPSDADFPVKNNYFDRFIPDSIFQKISISKFTDPNIFFVRELPFSFGIFYFPFIRGAIKVDQQTQEFTFDGLVNLYPILFILDIVLLSIGPHDIEIQTTVSILVFIFIPFFAVQYIIQYYRYNEIFTNIING